MDFQAALHNFMTAAGQEAENTTRRTLKHDVVLYLPDDPNSPGIRFGVGDHDWRLAYYQEPGKPSELLPIAEVAKRFTDYALDRKETQTVVMALPTEGPQSKIEPLPAIVQKGLPSG